jgi:predicted hydrolase (HD superfamily)
LLLVASWLAVVTAATQLLIQVIIIKSDDEQKNLVEVCPVSHQHKNKPFARGITDLICLPG